MEKDHKHGLKEIFEDDNLDEAVRAADDTGMVAEQTQIIEEEMLEHSVPLENPPVDDV